MLEMHGEGWTKLWVGSRDRPLSVMTLPSPTYSTPDLMNMISKMSVTLSALDWPLTQWLFRRIVWSPYCKGLTLTKPLVQTDHQWKTIDWNCGLTDLSESVLRPASDSLVLNTGVPQGCVLEMRGWRSQPWTPRLNRRSSGWRDKKNVHYIRAGGGRFNQWN